jgi:hypothetical protein
LERQKKKKKESQRGKTRTLFITTRDGRKVKKESRRAIGQRDTASAAVYLSTTSRR